MKVIFLDIDGVLNASGTKAKAPSGCTGIEKALLKKLRKIIEATGARVVLTSTWKSEIDKHIRQVTPDGKYMLNKFFYEGKFLIYDKTPDAKSSLHRGREINDWLGLHEDVEEFVILDDIYFDDFDTFYLTDRFVHTDTTVGLTDEDVDTAIKILNGARLERVEDPYEEAMTDFF